VDSKAAARSDDYPALWYQHIKSAINRAQLRSGARCTVVNGGRTWSSWDKSANAHSNHVPPTIAFRLVYARMQESGFRFATRAAAIMANSHSGDWRLARRSSNTLQIDRPTRSIRPFFYGRLAHSPVRISASTRKLAPEPIRRGEYAMRSRRRLFFSPLETAHSSTSLSTYLSRRMMGNSMAVIILISRRI